MKNTVIIERRGKRCKYFNDLKWVMEARDAKSQRSGLRGVFIDDDWIENGTYEIISANKDQITLRKIENDTDVPV